MATLVRRDPLAGALAGLLAGLAFGWAMLAQGMLPATATLSGLPATPAGLLLDLLLAALIGASFGALFRYQPGAYAATIGSGVRMARSIRGVRVIMNSMPTTRVKRGMASPSSCSNSEAPRICPSTRKVSGVCISCCR